MKIVVAGSFAKGLKIKGVFEDADSEKADTMVWSLLFEGVLAEVLEVNPPESVSGSKWGLQKGGNEFAVFSQGIGNGVDVYGPFDLEDDAVAFCEEYGEDADWTLWSFSPEVLEKAA